MDLPMPFATRGWFPVHMLIRQSRAAPSSFSFQRHQRFWQWVDLCSLVVLLPSCIRGTLLNSTPLNSLSSCWSPVPWHCLLLWPYCMCPDKGSSRFPRVFQSELSKTALWATLTSLSTTHCLPCWKNLISIPDNPTFSQSLDHGLME